MNHMIDEIGPTHYRMPKHWRDEEGDDDRANEPEEDFNRLEFWWDHSDTDLYEKIKLVKQQPKEWKHT